MTFLRPLAFLWALVGAFALLEATAQARSSRNSRNDRYGGASRLISGDSTDKTERERQRDEERKKKEEERNTKKDDTTKKPAAKPAAPAKPATVAKPAAPAKPKPTATATRRPGKPGTGTKTDDAREQEATKLREQADKALDKGDEAGLLAGAKLLRQAIADYDGTDAAASAQQQLDLLLADQKLGPMILLAEAQEEFDAQHYRKARNKFQELVQRFPNAAQAADGRAKLADIETNGLLKKSLYTDEELEDARLWFLAGNIHLENGRKGEAATAYRRVIEEYPGCRYAVLSEEKLPGTQGA